MSRTVHDIESAFYAEAEYAVDTDALLAAVVPAARRRRRRRLLGAGAVTATAVAVVIVAAPAIIGRPDLNVPLPDDQAAGYTVGDIFTGDCTVQALALPPEIATLNVVENLQVADMDTTGRFILSSVQELARDRAEVILWDNGIPSLLPLSHPYVLATAVNSQGVVVGIKWTSDSHDDPSAWIYSDGALALLPTPSGYDFTLANGINDRGEVAGVARTAAGASAAVVWAADDARTPRILAAPAAAEAHSIAADGTVVGVAYETDTPADLGRPYVWAPRGAGRFLDLPEGTTFAWADRVRGDWAGGFAVGTVLDPPPAGMDPATQPRTAVGVVWHVRTGEVARVVEVPGSTVPVNANGDIVINDGATSVLVHDGVSSALPHLSNDTWQQRSASAPVSEAVAVNDSATVIVGTHTSYDPDRPTPVVVWRC